MDILYRRFLLVSALIAVLGVLTANLIIETRRDSHQAIAVPGAQNSCGGLIVCRIDLAAGRPAGLSAA